MKLTIATLSAFLFSALLTSCAHDTCNNTPQRPPAGSLTTDATSAKAVFASPSPTPPAADPNSIQVYKPTGERQCGEAPATPIENVQAPLTKKNIPVSEAHTQPDGLMHMALCGSPSGMIYVFTINKKDLSKAQRLGFKVYAPQS